ncbi:MAG: TlyA family RNA methyltransferase [Anaerolineales bacterium]|nr:TlyA family RNA methyltransferase [Anaerolineales bacterium]
MPKTRLDQRLTELGLTPSREQARRLIMAGEVLVNGQPVDRPSAIVPDEAVITLKAKPRFVSRGGEKLEAALTHFNVDVAGRVCADVGASTGGFTDCLLQRGAARVYAVDVGRGVLDARLRADPRVVVMEGTNARHLARLPEPVSFVSIDVSFISLKLLLPIVKVWFPSSTLQSPSSTLIALIKPQFEAGRREVSRGGGVIKDPALHRRVLEDVLSYAIGQGYAVRGLLRSPLTGPKGNVEFLAWLEPGGEPTGLAELIQSIFSLPVAP